MAVFCVVTTAGPASAQIDCAGAHTASPATVAPTSVLPGGSLIITGSGFAANQVLGIGLFNPPVVLASTASSTTGTYSVTLQLPFATPLGQNEITVFGEGPDDTCHQSLGLFTVQAPTPITIVVPATIVTVVATPATTIPAIIVREPLARTGSPTPALIAAGLLAMLLGVHTLRAANRRPITD